MESNSSIAYGSVGTQTGPEEQYEAATQALQAIIRELNLPMNWDNIKNMESAEELRQEMDRMTEDPTWFALIPSEERFDELLKTFGRVYGSLDA